MAHEEDRFTIHRMVELLILNKMILMNMTYTARLRDDSCMKFTDYDVPIPIKRLTTINHK